MADPVPPLYSIGTAAPGLLLEIPLPANFIAELGAVTTASPDGNQRSSTSLRVSNWCPVRKR